MKLLIAIIAVWAAVLIALPHAWAKDDASNQAVVDSHKIEISGKAYKVVDGLASNEWVPLTSDGYVDDYDQSAKAKEIKAANESLKKIKG